jgi:hypothetical protein
LANRKSDVLTALVDRLWADSTLKGYVKTIKQGWEEKPEVDMPAIIIYPKIVENIGYELGNREMERFVFGIRLLIDIKDNPDYLVNTIHFWGLLDFEDDVKNAIVGGAVNDRGITNTALDVDLKTLEYGNEGDTTAWADLELGIWSNFFMSGQR